VTKLLVVNPNTTVAVTELLARRIGAAIGTAAEVEAITAPFGAAYIASEASYVVSAHPALAACSAHCDAHGRPDAIIVGCFGDPGVFALREALVLPVIGLAEAAMREAATHGRFSIVTGGAAWGPMLTRLARALELADRLATIEIVAATGAELAADRERALALLGDACMRAARGVDAVVLGGAALAGMAEAIAARLALAVPLIDSVDAAARAALVACRDS
jgi:Asp/Glu/hydantoin racemase